MKKGLTAIVVALVFLVAGSLAIGAVQQTAPKAPCENCAKAGKPAETKRCEKCGQESAADAKGTACDRCAKSAQGEPCGKDCSNCPKTEDGKPCTQRCDNCPQNKKAGKAAGKSGNGCENCVKAKQAESKPCCDKKKL